MLLVTDLDGDLLVAVIRRYTPASSKCTRHPAAVNDRRQAGYTTRSGWWWPNGPNAASPRSGIDRRRAYELEGSGPTDGVSRRSERRGEGTGKTRCCSSAEGEVVGVRTYLGGSGSGLPESAEGSPKVSGVRRAAARQGPHAR